MLYNANNPREYLDGLEHDWRKEILSDIREMILSNAPELEESIEYKMLSYGNEEKALFYLNARKAYVSLYTGDISKVENGRALLKELDLGKGCIRVKKNVNIRETGLEQFIINSIKAWK